MTLYNLKLIFRTLWRRRLYSIVILLSLALGFVCSNILISFLIYEVNTDSFHNKHERTFQIFSDDPFGSGGTIPYIPRTFVEYLGQNYPEVENSCVVSGLNNVIVHTEEEYFRNFSVLATDTSFFTLFDYPLLKGSTIRCLDPARIVLSRQMALTLFGHSDVVGRLISLSSGDSQNELSISAVLDEPVENSHMIFDALVHPSVFPEQSGGGATYALLKDKSSSWSIVRKVNSDSSRPDLLGQGNARYYFNPLSDSYFNTDNKQMFIKIRNPLVLTVGYSVCGLILFIASFNFISLLLLSTQERRKIVGVKKVLGIDRKGLLRFSFLETGVYIVLSFFVSIVITVYILPVFNEILDTSLSVRYLLNPEIMSLIAIVLFIIGVLSTWLSTSQQWSMSSIQLVARTSTKRNFSRVLFTLQFVISITLVICSVTVIQQMKHIRNASLGFNRYIVQINSPGNTPTPSLHVFKQQVTQFPGVANATISNGNPIFGNVVVRYELEDNRYYTPYLLGGDEDYFKTMRLKLKDGQFPNETLDGKLVNETLVRYFNLQKPVGEFVPGTKDIIVGVVEDFTCRSFKEEIPPMIISYHKEGHALLVDYAGSDLSVLLPQIEQAWTQIFPDHPFGYQVLQDELMSKYKDDIFFHSIVVSFAVVSILLSCFGLFALSWSVIQSRTKELGIRKVLGATALDILNLLTLTFTKRILLAFLIAIPLGYLAMNEWLSRFVNRIEVDVWIFITAGIITTIGAVLTLGMQTIKAVFANPVDEIRSE